MVTPDITITLLPSQQSFPMATGLATTSLLTSPLTTSCVEVRIVTWVIS